MKITDKLQEIERGQIIMLLASAERYMEINLEVLEYLANEKGMPGIYVTVNKPYKILKRLISERGIKTDKLLFIDAITKEIGGGEEVEDCVFLESPENLTEISITSLQAVEAIDKEDKFILFDSMSILALYNSIQTLTQFSHYFLQKMSMEGVVCVVVSIEKEMDEKLKTSMLRFCDKIIRS